MKPTRWSVLAGWGALFVLLAVIGGLLLFNRFMYYDDEGYVLWSVRNYVAGHALYDEVYTQYGPVFFLGYRALHLATGLAFDNDVGRFLTLGYWLAASAMAAACARLLTGSRLVAGATCGLAFVALIDNTAEPFHPGALLAFLSGIVAWLGARAIVKGDETRFPAAAALVAAAAALMKINVGGLLFIALGSWMVANSRAATRPSAPLAAVPALLPSVLMASQLGDPRFLCFALVVGAAIFGLGWFLLEQHQPVFPLASWTWVVVGPAVLTTCVIGVLLVQDSSAGGILNGILLGPLRHPGVYTFAPKFPLWAPMLTATSLGLCVFASRHPMGATLLAVTRLTATGWFLLDCLPSLVRWGPDRFAFYFGPAFALLFASPPPGRPATAPERAALWLAWVFIWQTLHAYPVAGSQVAWGCYLWVPLCAYGFVRGVRHFDRPSRSFARVGALALVGASLVSLLRIAEIGWIWQQNGAPLGFVGARHLRAEPAQSDDIRHVRRNLLLHADMVFSLPGMFSFNIWTGLPSPTQANVTHWFNLLDEPRQRRIIAALENARRPAVVVAPDHLAYLAENHIPVGGPLVDYLRDRFRPAIGAGVYEIWLPREQDAPAADSFTLAPDGFEAWTDTLPAPVFAALLYDKRHGDAPVRELHPSAARPWTSEPAPDTPGLVRHRLRIPRLAGPAFSDRLRIELVDHDGRVMATCRFDRVRQKLIDDAPPAAD